MKKIGRGLVEKKKAAIMASHNEKDSNASKDDTESRDLLTLLMRANLATDIPENQRLSDDDVIAREFTLVFKPPAMINLYAAIEIPTSVRSRFHQ